VHVVLVVHARVVDQALPPGDRARLFEVDPHDDKQVRGVLVAQRGEPAGVIQRRHRIMHRARPGDHQQPVVLPGQHGLDLGAGALDHRRGLVAERQFVKQRRWREQRLIADDPGV